jgi:hypothetical protein
LQHEHVQLGEEEETTAVATYATDSDDEVRKSSLRSIWYR